MGRSRGKQILCWTALGGLVLFVSLQFISVDRTNPPVEASLNAPDDVEAILRRACYDCHSHETRWPWYGYIAPTSWYLVSHVEDARADLNFSRWPTFDFEAQELAFDDIREQVSKGKMPLKSYKLMHPAARLSAEDRDRLIHWTRGQP